MTVASLLAELRVRGVTVRERAGDLVVSPPAALQDGDREALRALKPEVLAALRHQESTAQETLRRRFRLGELAGVVEIEVPDLGEPLLLVAGCARARALRSKDRRPGRVWCVCEVIDLLMVAVPPADARKIAEAKLAFAGCIVAARAA